ncbi:MAG: hypothetical protein ACYTEX_24720 [Planctomycetota bacterium]|jgi:hypothetical protein
MRLCIVGQGPSAEGKYEEIDSCDFVVRIKSFWKHGADRAGRRLDALASYGDWGGWKDAPSWVTGGDHEYWLTQTVLQIKGHPNETAWQRLEFVSQRLKLRCMRWLPVDLWRRAEGRLGSHPSTGFVSVCMAMEIKRPDELVLYGFDSTLPGRPNYGDARHPDPNDRHSHDVLEEKRAIAEILRGTWLGKPTSTKLIWPDMPDLT